MQNNTDRVAVWRYLLAIVVFWLSPILFSVIASWILYVINLFTPGYLQRTQEGVIITADIVAVVASSMLAYAILKERCSTFCGINCVLLAGVRIYSLVCLYLSPATQSSDYYAPVAILIAYVVAVVYFFKRSKTDSKAESKKSN